MDVLLFVAVGIAFRRRAPEACRLADIRLVEFPQPRRPHEGLVVEPGRQQPGKPVVDTSDIETHRRPAILAFRAQALEKLDRRRPHVRVCPGAGTQLNQRVGLFRTAAEDAARAMVFEAAADQVNTVREQRRCKRIATVPEIAVTVEAECDLFTAVDTATRGESRPLPPHDVRPGMTGRCFVHQIDRMYLVADRIADHMKPFAATLRMAPAFVVKPLGVLPHEQVVGPGRIVDRVGASRPRDMRLAAAMEFAYVAFAAPGARYPQHVSFAPWY